eukprot:CAMPEP_0206141784 /NCGR_PEP_ID=MMETSP1473-20131121/14105_1 /ASSEMBLY_ACC=CAM_ASM_001109 /TAXON_ID=1461547 /ORGANISM="Stichococcus sp, Strain RCC1054" /LENGTH=211 /DNA_ID=CAMNT_0053536475 /DNA_START=73 /DNA_END=704 /DNA_ORIENTATION=-
MAPSIEPTRAVKQTPSKRSMHNTECTDASGRHRAKGCVSWAQVEVFLAMAEDALKAKSIANELLQTEAELARQQLLSQTEEYDEVVQAENALLDDSGFLKQQLEALLQERAGFKESIARLERENMFLLEERDLLSQQLAAETSATPGQRGLPGQRVVSPVPYATPTTPSGGGWGDGSDPLSGGRWTGFRTVDGGSIGTPPFSRTLGTPDPR